jgi:hypothetical protein
MMIRSYTPQLGTFVGEWREWVMPEIEWELEWVPDLTKSIIEDLGYGSMG